MLPRATRVILVKADSSVLIFSELGSYKPLNWMAAPCRLREYGPDSERWESLVRDTYVDDDPDDAEGDEEGSEPVRFLRATAEKGPDILTVAIYRVHSDQTFDLGSDPGLVKDGVEDHLQRYLAEQIERIGEGARLIRREYPTAIGPVDIMAEDADGTHVAIEIKRHGEIGRAHV